MNEKRLGKITKASFGLGGYQECMIGLHLTFEFGGSGICTDYCAWDANKIKHSESCKWTEEDRSEQYDEIVRKLSDILEDARVYSVSDLVGIPVEVELENRTFKDFRVLTEVL